MKEHIAKLAETVKAINETTRISVILLNQDNLKAPLGFWEAPPQNEI